MGGGPFCVPLFTVLLDFGVKAAAALSSAVVAGGGLSGTLYYITQCHPCDPRRPLIDYRLSLVLTPSVLVGSSIGVLGNKLLPAWLVTLVLLVLLTVLTWRMASKALLRAELKLRALHRQIDGGQEAPLAQDKEEEEEEDERTLQHMQQFDSPRVDLQRLASHLSLAPNMILHLEMRHAALQPKLLRRAATMQLRGTHHAAALHRFLSSPPRVLPEPRRRESWSMSRALSRGFRAGSFGRGSSRARRPPGPSSSEGALSGKGAMQGGPSYHVNGYAALSHIVSPFSAGDGGLPVHGAGGRGAPALESPFAQIAEGAAHSDDAQETEFEEPDYTHHGLLHISAYALLAGVLAGLLGIGGGSIISPLLIELRVNPAVGGATASLMVVFSGSLSLLSYALNGSLNVAYGAVYGITAFVAAAVGATAVGHIVRRTGKVSLIVIAMATVLSVALVVQTVFGLRTVIIDFIDHTQDSFSPFCN
ncbi:hypothetical protein WJX81_007428 [Elliptochloris bilobata]|uniref:Sulfite exporter TauE/SafE family protein n=1 Tax=Elliptochloris bilobata TaxID=381761 RepID=A0AAW1RMP2_9CHLO